MENKNLKSVIITFIIIFVLFNTGMIVLINILEYEKIIVQNKEIVQLDNGKKIYYLKGEGEVIEVNQKIYKLAKVNSTMRIQHRDIVTIVKIKE